MIELETKVALELYSILEKRGQMGDLEPVEEHVMGEILSQIDESLKSYKSIK